MFGHVIWYITYNRCLVIWYHRCMVMSLDSSPIIDTWLCHMIHHLPSITIDTWLCHMICHLLSMPGHVIWCITHHRCMSMSYITSTSIDAWSCLLINHLPSMHGHTMLCITFHRYIDMFHLPPMYGHIICYTSPSFDDWLHHPPLMHWHVHIIMFCTKFFFLSSLWCFDSWSCCWCSFGDKAKGFLH